MLLLRTTAKARFCSDLEFENQVAKLEDGLQVQLDADAVNPCRRHGKVSSSTRSGRTTGLPPASPFSDCHHFSFLSGSKVAMTFSIRWLLGLP